MSDETLIVCKALLEIEIKRLEGYSPAEGLTPGWIIEARAKLRYAWAEIYSEMERRGI